MALILMLSSPAAGQVAWQPVEQEQFYAIHGSSGIDLYASIGERGPKVGSQVRAIAHTNFKLTWTRDYRPQPDGSCTLVTARPRLVITYTLPKPEGVLSPQVKARWERFIAGIRKHEQVHGRQIVQMVKQIEEASLGLSAPDDLKCTKVRAALQAKLGEISKARQESSSDFDRAEMSDGGNVHQLILQLVNE